MNHDKAVRPENLWVRPEFEQYESAFLDWWLRTYYRNAHDLGVGPTTHYRLFQRILGRQTTTVTFTHRNWVWDGAEEGWVLYVDRRGPAFHVTRNDASEAWAAFKKFRDRVDAWMAENHPGSSVQTPQ